MITARKRLAELFSNANLCFCVKPYRYIKILIIIFIGGTEKEATTDQVTVKFGYSSPYYT